MSLRGLVAAVVLAAPAQAADLTIFVDGDLLEHGGVVEVTTARTPDAPSGAQSITLTDRFATVLLRHLPDTKYGLRFQVAPDAAPRDGLEKFATELLRYGGRDAETTGGTVDGNWQAIRVFPFAEYGAPDAATRTNAAWGVTQRYATPPPGSHWGARALMGVFAPYNNGPKPGLICADAAAIPVCVPDPKEALLLEALWWRSIAESRLGRLEHEALSDCYDSGGLFGRPERCTGVPGRGWPEFVPAN